MMVERWIVCALACCAVASPVAAQDDELDFLLGEPEAAASPPQSPTEPAVEQGAQVAPPSPAEAPSANVEPYPQSVPVAEAAPQPRQSVRPQSGSRLVEEIIVTAQKREENLQDVPISVSAFSADLLDARGITDPKDLPLATPGLTLGASAGFTVTFLRGVGSDAFLMADPSVAMYIDGVYFPFAHGLAQNFGAIERVEVLKGPQGTLFGRNAVGGAISVITKAPSFEAPEVSLQTSFGNYADLQTRAHVNIPITDTFALSASGIYNNMESYIDGTAAGRPLPDENSRGGRVKLRWAPVDALDLQLAGFRLQQQGTGTMFALNSEPSLVARTAGVRPQTGYDGSVDAPVYFDLDNRVVYGQATLYTDWFDVKLIGSDQYVITHSLYDFDGSTMPLVSFEAKNQYADVQSAELQILSNDTTWGSERLQWIVGAYWFQSRQGFDPNRLNVAGVDLGQGTVLGRPLPGIVTTILDRLVGNVPVLGLLPTGTVVLVSLIDTESIAGFAQATYHFTDHLALTLGGRYQEETRTVVKSSSNLETFNGGTIPLFDFGSITGRGEDTTTSFKPKVSLELRVLEDTLLYLSWQEAIKSGTFNVVNIYDPPDYVEPEELEAWEVGVKTTFFDGLMSFSAAAFNYDITNLQVQFISLLQGGAVTFENAGGARIRGADFDTTIQLFPSLTPGLVLTAGGAFLDGEYTDYRRASGFAEGTGLLSVNNDYTGNRVTRTPEFSGTIGLSQTFQTARGPLEISGEYYYNSGYYYLAQNQSMDEERSYGVLGARISYLYEPWRLRMTVFGKNITDTDYNYGRFTNDFGALDAKAPPALYGLRLNWDF